MSQTEGRSETEEIAELKRRINELVKGIQNCCYPAMNVLRGIELDIQNHKICPYQEMSKKAVNNLMDLLELTKC